MNYARLYLLGLIATTALAAGAESSPWPPPQPTPPLPLLSFDQLVDRLSESEVSAALEKLRGSFLEPSAVSEEGVRRAALRGFISQWSPGIELDASSQPPTSNPFPFLAEILDSHIAYVRPGTLDASSLAQLEATVEGFKDKGVDSLILDLRAVAGGEDFEMAANFARRFVPKGKILFSLQRPVVRQERIFTSSQEPMFDGLLIVLIDGRTSGAAEALAASLRENAGALLVGTDSAGSAVEYEPFLLGNGSVLRVAVARVVLPGRGPLFPGRVKPDVAISVPTSVLDEIFRESGEKGVSQFVFEMERRRMNEAALVANTNPELDSAQSFQRERSRKASLKDAALQRAVDLVTAIQFYKAKRRN